MPPFETYFIPTKGPDPYAGRPTRPLGGEERKIKTIHELGAEVIARHEAVAKSGGKVVAQHMITAPDRIPENRHDSAPSDQYIMIVAELPEAPSPAEDAPSSESAPEQLYYGATID